MLTIPYRKPETPEEAVANGVAWLDEYVPDWWNHIEVRELDLGSTCKCILGQLSGGHTFNVLGNHVSAYEVATGLRFAGMRNRLLRGTLLRYMPMVEHPEELGFGYASEHLYEDADEIAAYAELSRLWIRVIDGRRSLSLED